MIQLRQILINKISQARYRVVYVSGADAWLMPIEKQDGNEWPFAITKDSVACDYLEESEPITTLTTKNQHAATSLYERFKIAFEDITQLLTPKGRASVFEELRTSDPSIRPKIFYSTIRKWLSGGCVPTALISKNKLNVSTSLNLTLSVLKQINFKKARNVVREQSARLSLLLYIPPKPRDYTKEGKPRKRAVCEFPTTYRIDEDTLRVFLHYYLRHERRPGSTLTGIYQELRREVFSNITPTGEHERFLDHVCPSFAQFEHYYYRLVPYKTRSIADRGEKDWNLNRRAKLAQAVTAAYSAGNVGSLDATVWPVELVSDDEHALLIGPPIVFRVRDRNNGMTLGIAVGLESASWMGAASAIANCNECKVEFCKNLGIDITHEDWPIQGLPNAIEADCGETHNRKPNAFISITKTELRNIQVGRGDLKAGVESDWSVIQLALCDMTPAAIIEKFKDKTRNQWRVKAKMTLKAFTKILVIEELKRMKKTRPSLNLPAYMIGAGIDNSPLSMWNWEIKTNGGGLRAFNQEKVKLSLLNIENGAITEKGLLFRGLFYTADTSSLSFAFEKARQRGRRTVQVGFDPRLIDIVYIIVGDPEHPEGYIKCPLNTARMDQNDLLAKTFREVLHLQQQLNRQNKISQKENSQRIDDWTTQQGDLIAAETKRVEEIRKDTPISNNQLLSSRTPAREKEKGIVSPTLALTAEGCAVPAVPALDNVIPIRPTIKKRRSTFADRAADFDKYANGEPSDD